MLLLEVSCGNEAGLPKLVSPFVVRTEARAASVWCKSFWVQGSGGGVQYNHPRWVPRGAAALPEGRMRGNRQKPCCVGWL